jgi:hypothetical protein
MEEFFTKVPDYSIEKCEKPFPLLIDFDLKHCIKTETFKNLSTGRSICLTDSLRGRGHFPLNFSIVEFLYLG